MPLYYFILLTFAISFFDIFLVSSSFVSCILLSPFCFWEYFGDLLGACVRCHWRVSPPAAIQHLTPCFALPFPDELLYIGRLVFSTIRETTLSRTYQFFTTPLFMGIVAIRHLLTFANINLHQFFAQLWQLLNAGDTL